MKLADLAYKVEGKFIRSANRLMRAHPSSAPFVSGDAFRALADHVGDIDSVIDPGAVENGDVVFVATHELTRFRAETLPAIAAKFILITHNSDEGIDEPKAELAEDVRIVKWFAQNDMAAHSKIVRVPIGLENRWRHNNGIIGDYRRLLREEPEKVPRILYGFSVGTNAAERGPALEALKAAPGADALVWTNSRAYRRKLSGYCFVASPPGNGVDCHRTWEALYLGVLPIVKRSPLYDGFPGLPAVLVDDWREVATWNELRLREMYESLAVDPREIDCLWMGYWERAIAAARLEA
jgi:hypothetical protein